MPNTHAHARAPLGAIHHLTANTGHVLMQPRTPDMDDAMRRLAPVIAAGGGSLWAHGLHLRVDNPPKARGWASFGILDEGQDGAGVILGTVCWDEQGSWRAWAALQRGYRKMKNSLQRVHLWRPLPDRPPAAPWMAVCITPFVGFMAESAIGMLGDIERCVAWALVEAATGRAPAPEEAKAPADDTPFPALGELAEHVWYPGYMSGLPDMLVLGVPEGLDEDGPFRAVFVETEQDRREVLDALGKPLRMVGGRVHFAETIDRPMVRRSTLPPGDMRVCLYEPPEPDWPYVVVTVLNRNTPGLGMARERYGWDWFPNEEAAHRHLAGMMAATHAAMPGSVRISVPGLSDA